MQSVIHTDAGNKSASKHKSVWPKASGHRSLGQRPRCKVYQPVLAEGHIHRVAARLIPDVLFVELNAVACEHRPIFVLKRPLPMMFLLVADVMFRLIAILRTD